MDELIMLDNILPIEIALQREVEYRKKVESLSLCDSDNHAVILENDKSVMDDEEIIMLDNLMPVDIALERELEYRRRIESFREQPQLRHSNHQAPPLILVPPSFPIKATKKRKAPETTPGFHLGKNRQAFEMKVAFLSCSACKVSFSAPHNLKHHIASTSHKGKLQWLKANGYQLSNPLICELCNATCSSEVPLESHLNGTKHKSALERLRASLRLQASIGLA